MNSDDVYLSEMLHESSEDECPKLSKSDVKRLKESGKKLGRLVNFIDRMNQDLILLDEMHTYGMGEELIHYLKNYTWAIGQIEYTGEDASEW